MGERTDVGFLDDILGLAIVPQDTACNAVQPAIVFLYHRPNRGFFACADLVIKSESSRRAVASTGTETCCMMTPSSCLPYSLSLDASQPV